VGSIQVHLPSQAQIVFEFHHLSVPANIQMHSLMLLTFLEVRGKWNQFNSTLALTVPYIDKVDMNNGSAD
jgi:hypothetical protein